MGGEMSETPWRLYALTSNGEPERLAACDEYAIGEALLDLRRRGKEVRGIMFRPFDDEPGEWLVNPWSHGPPSHAAWSAAGSGRLRSATSEGGRDARVVE